MFADFRGQKSRPSGSNATQTSTPKSGRKFGSHSRFPNRNRPARNTRQFQTGSTVGEKLEDRAGLRIIPLGGCEEVGRNMTMFEYEDDIIILDMGLQFPEEDMPGIDYIIPNTKYLVGKEKRIRGVIFSHGHLDHIGAAPILLEKLGNPTIIGRDLTLALIKNKQEDYKQHSAKNLKTITVKNLNDTLRLGKFTVKLEIFLKFEHSPSINSSFAISMAYQTSLLPE